MLGVSMVTYLQPVHREMHRWRVSGCAHVVNRRRTTAVLWPARRASLNLVKEIGMPIDPATLARTSAPWPAWTPNTNFRGRCSSSPARPRRCSGWTGLG